MSAQVHPSIDELAELAEGLIPDPRKVEIDEHLAGCAACRRTVEGLREVTVLLAADAAHPATMPSDVAGRLTAALARETAARSARVTPLRRAESSPEPSPSRARGWHLLAAAAAVAAVVAGGVSLAHDFRQAGPSMATAGKAGGTGNSSDASNRRGPQAGGGASSLPAQPPATAGGGRAGPADVRLMTYVRRLVAGTADTRTLPRSCASPVSPATSGTISSGVIYRGQADLLLADRVHRTFVVLSCRRTDQVLYRGSY